MTVGQFSTSPFSDTAERLTFSEGVDVARSPSPGSFMETFWTTGDSEFHVEQGHFVTRKGVRTSAQRSGEQIILTSHQPIALRLFVVPSEDVFLSIEEHHRSDEIP